MTQLKDYMINESSEFSTMENNPMIYVLIIPKLLKVADTKVIKEDKVLKNAIDLVEKFVKELSKNTIKDLKTAFKPYIIMDMFKLSNNYKATLDNYLRDFRSLICNNESNFIKCIELDKKLTALYNSPEFTVYKNTL